MRNTAMLQKIIFIELAIAIIAHFPDKFGLCAEIGQCQHRISHRTASGKAGLKFLQLLIELFIPLEVHKLRRTFRESQFLENRVVHLCQNIAKSVANA